MTIRVALFSMFEFSADRTLAAVFEADGVEVTSVSFMRSISNSAGSSLVSSAIQLAKKMSFKYWVFLVATNASYWAGQLLIPGRLKHLVPNHRVGLYMFAKKRGVPIRRVRDVNGRGVLERLSEEKVDVLVIRVPQILGSSVISSPAFGTLCLHSSLLPSYKGIAGEFHARLEGNKFIGSSLFEVNEEIDAGDVVSQAAFEVDDSLSVRKLILSNNRLGREILREYLTQLSLVGTIFTQTPTLGVQESYRTWPTKGDIKRGRRLGIKLW